MKLRPARARLVLIVALALLIFYIVIRAGVEYTFDPRHGPDSIGAKALEEKVRAVYHGATLTRFAYYEANRGTKKAAVAHWALARFYQGDALEAIEQQRADWPVVTHSNSQRTGIKEVTFDSTYSTATLVTLETWYVTDINERKLFAENTVQHVITLELSGPGWVVTGDRVS